MKHVFVPVLAAVAALWGAADAAAQEQDLIALELGARTFIGDANGRLRNQGNHVRIDDDLDAAADNVGGGISLTGWMKGNHTFNIQAWQYSSDGEATFNEGQTFGSLAITPGQSASTDVDVRYVSAKMVFGLTPERDPFRIGLGFAGKVIDWKTEITLDTGERDSLKMRTIYPSAEIEASYRIGEAVELRGEGGIGMPAYAKKTVEIQTPIEARAGVRITLGGLTIEGGYQVYDALLIAHDNQPEEESANVNLSGVYFELAARF